VAENIENLILDHLRAIRGDLAALDALLRARGAKPMTHWAVICEETKEEQRFETREACLQWADRVVHTFQ
jgi:hypothetical protein